MDRPVSPRDATELAAARELADACYPSGGPPAPETSVKKTTDFALAFSGAALTVFALVGSQWRPPLYLLASLCLSVALVVPAVAAVGWWVRRRHTKLAAASEVRRLLTDAAAGDQRAAVRVQAFAATLAAADMAHADVDTDVVGAGMAAADHVGAVGGLAFSLIGSPTAPRPATALEVIDLAEATSDPLFRSLVTLVGDDLAQTDRIGRVRQSLDLAHANDEAHQLYTTLSGEWCGTLDELDEAAAALASTR